MADSKLLIYLMRRDLRVSDNPILHALTTTNHGFTHLLPVYIFPAEQVEISGFIEGVGKSPYPEARSEVGGFWRCGPYRAKFLAESVWDLKEGLERVGSGLCIRTGKVADVVNHLLKDIKDVKVGAVWMIKEEGVEEDREERGVKKTCAAAGVNCKLWVDEKYFIDEYVSPPDLTLPLMLTLYSRDLGTIQDPQDLPDVFTTYRKMMEPLREAPRKVLSTPKAGSLPPYPTEGVPPQAPPFTIPITLDGLNTALQKPLSATPLIKDPPAHVEGAKTVHPFKGGESNAHKRVQHLLAKGAMSAYKETRNGMLGEDFSSKVSAYLAVGCITARQIHASMKEFEDGSGEKYKDAPGFGKGENEGTKAMRFELLWRDYMRLCTRKFGEKLFRLSGFKEKSGSEQKWSSPRRSNGQSPSDIQETIERFLNGTTGMGLIDASQRELFHTGYTSNRARQNVASFLSKHLYVDWRFGAEYYESMLVDYDLSSNWGNWQYVAGVGNDPRDDSRVFNPVKQSFDYDPEAEYIKTWIPEARGCETTQAFQLCTVPEGARAEKGLAGLTMVERPLKRLHFTVGKNGGKRPNNDRNRGDSGTRRGDGGQWPRGRGRGGGGYGQFGQPPPQQNYGGRGYGSSRGHIRGYYTGRGRGRGEGGGGREARTGTMDKEREAESVRQIS